MKFDDFNWDDILMEAPEDEFEDEGGEEELGPTDYADAENLEIEEEEPTDEEGTNTGEEDLGEGEEGLDDEGLEGEGTGDEESLEDESLDEEQTDNDDVSSDIVSNKQNKYLIHDFIELYNRMDSILFSIRSDVRMTIRINPNHRIVRQNIEKLRQLTYDYITDKFTKESYVSNLYQFNLIIQALNVNLDLLDEMSKALKKEEDKKKKPNRKTKKR